MSYRALSTTTGHHHPGTALARDSACSMSSWWGHRHQARRCRDGCCVYEVPAWMQLEQPLGCFVLSPLGTHHVVARQSHGPCALLRAPRSPFCAHRYRMFLSSRRAFKSPNKREGLAQLLQTRTAGMLVVIAGRDCPFSQTPKAKAAGPESSAQISRDLGLHREGTWCSCPCPLYQPIWPQSRGTKSSKGPGEAGLQVQMLKL